MAENEIKIEGKINISASEKTKKSEKEIKAITEDVKNLETASKKATNSTSKGFDNVTSSLKKTKKASDDLEKSEGNAFIKRVKRVTSTIGLYASFGAAIYGTVNYIKQMAMEMLELDRALTKVAAITGSTKKAIDSIKSSITITAAKFNIGTAELSKFAITMSKLGLNADEIKNISNEAVTLSKILGEDMSEAGTLVVTTLKSFNMTIAESSKVSAVFYDLIRKTPAGINELRTAMQYVAPAAEATGVSLEEAGAMMELLFNRGLKASKIGTGLRNMFAEISSSGDNVIDTLRDMSESGFSFSDSVEMFGKRGALAATLLVSNFKELEQLIADDLPSSIELLNSAFKANESILDRYGSAWERIKMNIQASREEMQDYYNAVELDKFRKLIESAGYDPNTVYADIRNGMAIGDFYNKYGALKGSSSVAVNIIRSMFGEEANLKDQIERAKKQALSDLASKLGVDMSSDDTIQTLLTKYIVDEKSGGLAIQKIGELYSQSVKNLQSAPDNQIFQSMQKELQTFAGIAEAITSTSMVSREAVFEYQKYFDSKGDIRKLAYGDIGEREKFLKKAEESQKKLKVFCESGDEYVTALGLCEQFRKKRKPGDFTTTGVTSFDKSSFEFESPDSKDWARIYGISSNPADAEEFINDYYEKIKKAITEEEQSTLLDIQSNRDKLTDQYNSVDSDLAQALIGANPEDTKKINAERLRIAKEYGDEIANLEKQSVDVKKKAIKAKEDAEKNYVSFLDKIQGDIDKFNEEQTNKELKRIEEKWQDIGRITSEAISTLNDIYNKFAQENLNNRLENIASELDAVKRRAEVESDILQSQFDNNIITAEAYAKKRTELEKKRIEEENRLNKAAFEAQKRADINAAKANGVAQAAQAFIQGFISGGGYPYGLIVGGAAAALVGVKAAAEVDAIKQRKFYPVKYADGGEVIGRSHAEGGVPFSVSGQGGYEMEGGEFIVNKDATAKYKPLLEAINGKNKMYSDTKFFADGGMVQDVRIKDSQMNQQLIRAYITKRDLRDYEKEERNIKSISKI